MRLDPNFVHDSGKLFARGARSLCSHDLVVAAVLPVLLVVAILTRAAISIDVGDSSPDRQSYVAFVIDVVVTLGLSWLLFSSRTRADDEGARP